MSQSIKDWVEWEDPDEEYYARKAALAIYEKGGIVAVKKEIVNIRIKYPIISDFIKEIKFSPVDTKTSSEIPEISEVEEYRKINYKK